MAVAPRLLSKPVSIRAMQPDDADQLLALINDVVDERYFLRAKVHYPRSAIEKFLQYTASAQNIMLVAQYNQQVVAWLDIIAAREQPEKGMLGMGVAKSFRQQQIGRELLQQALAQAVGKLRYVHLEVYESNAVAISLYKHFGFVEIERKSGILTMSKAIPESLYPKC